MKPPVFLLALFLTVLPGWAGETNSIAMNAINALGIDLLHQTARPNANALLSPYSIQMAMAMTCAGADGQTRAEMAKVLRYPTAYSVRSITTFAPHTSVCCRTFTSRRWKRGILSTMPPVAPPILIIGWNNRRAIAFRT